MIRKKVYRAMVLTLLMAFLALGLGHPIWGAILLVEFALLVFLRENVVRVHESLRKL